MRDPPTCSCQVKPQRAAAGTAGFGYTGSGVNWAQVQSRNVLFLIECCHSFYAQFEMEIQTKKSDIWWKSTKLLQKQNKTGVVVLNVFLQCNWENNLVKMNQVIALHFSLPCRDRLSQLGKPITQSININLDVKYYTDQSVIPLFPLQEQHKHWERAEREIKHIFRWRALNSETVARAGKHLT